MSERRSFVDELRELDRGHQEERLRPGAVHRIARRLDAELLQAELPARRRPWIPMISFAAGAALVLAVFALGGEPELATPESAAPAPMHAAWQVGGDNCHVTRGEVELVLDGSCRVEPPRGGVVIESRATTRLRPVDGGMALVDGTAMLESLPRTEADHDPEPWHIEVPGGMLEVLASRLSVVVSGDRGHVDLLEGTMRFVASDGRTTTVEPGERFRFSSARALAWTSPAAIEPDAVEPPQPLGDAAPEDGPPAPSTDEIAPPLAAGQRLAELARETEAPRSRPSSRSLQGREAPSSDELRRIVDRVAELRAQRQYSAAASLLRDALAKRWDRRTREVLGYELGTILSKQPDEHPEACRHFAEHRRRFPSGRYARAIARAEERLGCGD